VSAFANLVQAVSFASGFRDGMGYVGVFVCYLDDSDAELSRVATIGGYIATPSGWDLFEKHAAKVFTAHGITALRGKDFHHKVGQFKGWSDERRINLVDDLYRPLGQMLTMGISSSAGKTQTKKMKSLDKHYSSVSPYGSTFQMLMGRLFHDDRWALLFRQKGVAFVIEAGNLNNSGLQTYFNAMTKPGAPLEEQARSITFVPKNSSKAIQLADFHAFHARRYHAKHASRDDIDIPPDGVFARILDHLYHEHGSSGRANQVTFFNPKTGASSVHLI